MFKYILIVGIVLCTNIVFSAERITTKPNLFGGQNIYKNGNYIGKSIKGPVNTTYYFNNRKYNGFSQNNLFGGSNYYFNSKINRNIFGQ